MLIPVLVVVVAVVLVVWLGLAIISVKRPDLQPRWHAKMIERGERSQGAGKRGWEHGKVCNGRKLDKDGYCTTCGERQY